eukprot:XP_024464276.1 UDP-glycosyltransferase 87A1 [Populus trichocarpa]
MGYIYREAAAGCHVVAMPYPGRGQINPMMELCKSLVRRKDDIRVTFVVTEEWLSFIGSDPKPDQISFSTIPNVVPSELVRASNMLEFFEALMTNMEAPFERFLDHLVQPPAVIIADTYLLWAVRVGNRKNIPVASFWPMSVNVFLMFHYLDLLRENGQFLVDLLERGYERADYIPGVSSTSLVDFPSFINGSNPYMLGRIVEVFSWVPKAQYLLFPSIYELEPQAIDAIKAGFSFPVYTVGPSIPYSKLEDGSHTITAHGDIDYLRWLDDQPSKSVLYISMGSFLSFSSAQMDEIAGGLHDSGVRYLWVARGETSRLKEVCGDKGLVVPWCDQLRVLCHPSVGGFWTHCGWNSVREGVFAGVPFLTYLISADQRPNSKLIVEDWKVGWRVEKEYRVENLVRREEIGGLVRDFMDLDSNEGKEMRRRVKGFQEICQQAISKDGSSETNIKSFIREISIGHLSC